MDQSLGISHKAAGRWRAYGLSFHPFRLYPLVAVLDTMRWSTSRTTILYGHGIVRAAERNLRWFRDFSRTSKFQENLNWWNGIADPAILLESLYWPTISSKRSGLSMIQAGRAGTHEASRLAATRIGSLLFSSEYPKPRLPDAMNSSGSKLRVSTTITNSTYSCAPTIGTIVSALKATWGPLTCPQVELRS